MSYVPVCMYGVYAGLYLVAQKTQVLQEGLLTPYDHIAIYMSIHVHGTLRNTDHLSSSDEKPAEKSTEKCSISVSFYFKTVPSTDRNRPKPTDFSGKDRKIDRATAVQFPYSALYVRVCEYRMEG